MTGSISVRRRTAAAWDPSGSLPPFCDNRVSTAVEHAVSSTLVGLAMRLFKVFALLLLCPIAVSTGCSRGRPADAGAPPESIEKHPAAVTTPLERMPPVLDPADIYSA